MSRTSVWQASASESNFPTLSKNLSVDVAIIGGGITGITAAYNLSRSGKRVVVLEAGKIGEGDTGSSTGNLYSAIGSPGLHTIRSKFDDSRLKDVVSSRESAVQFIRKRVEEFDIDCDFQTVPWCLFTETDDNTDFINKEKEALRVAGKSVSDKIPIDLQITDGILLPDQAQFNPLQYVKALAAKIVSPPCQIFENTRVTGVEENGHCTIQTKDGTITAEHAIMATHTPLGVYFIQTLLGPYREYAIAAKLNGAYPPPGIFWDRIGEEQYSMRIFDSPKGRVLLALGETHKTGQRENNRECFVNLEKFLQKRFDVASVEYRWSAQQFKPANGLPYIGLSTGNEKIYIATGFAADGLTYGTLAGMIITDEILGVDNPWSETFKASRITPLASAKKFVKENVNVAVKLVTDHLSGSDATYFDEVTQDQGKIITIEGHKCAVSKDSSGRLQIVSAVCTHMGCVVQWNQVESSWDCPCHGSRFSTDGKVLEGPAVDPLEKIEYEK